MSIPVVAAKLPTTVAAAGICVPAVVILIFIVSQIEPISGGANERRLISDLLANYQKYERPVQNESHPVELTFTLSLQQIIDLDERNQLLKTNLWLDYSWHDVNLRWNKVGYAKRVVTTEC